MSGTHAVGTPEEYAEAVTSTLREALAERSLRQPHLLLEPGRRLVSNATVLLTRVGVVKRLPTGSTTWANVDASTNHCLRVPLQGYRYEIVHATTRLDPARRRRRERRRPDVRGRPPRRADACPPLAAGDLLAVLDVGGYAEVLATQFNLAPAAGDGATSRRTYDVVPPGRRSARRPPGDRSSLPERLAWSEGLATRCGRAAARAHDENGTTVPSSLLRPAPSSTRRCAGCSRR